MSGLIGKYKKVGVLGAGAQGEVFLVENEENEKLALKLYEAGTNAEEVVREIKLLIHLEHPNIILIQDYGRLPNGQAYIVMDYVPDGSLEQLDEDLDIRDKVKIFRDAAQALLYLHESGVVHRDIKPGNIFLKKLRNSYKGYLGDFGLAKHAEDQTLARSLHGGLGSELYLPPEVLTNQEELSPKSDVYALGISMYRSLTGKFPYGDNLPELIDHLQNQVEPPPISEYLDGLPKDFGQLVEQMIHHDIKQRVTSLSHCIQVLKNTVKNKSLHQTSYLDNSTGIYTKRSLIFEGYRKVFLPLLIIFTLIFAAIGIYTKLNPSPTPKTIKITKKNTVKKNPLQPTDKKEESNFSHEKKTYKIWAGLPNIHQQNIAELKHTVQQHLRDGQRRLPQDYVNTLFYNIATSYNEQWNANQVEIFNCARNGALLLKLQYSSFLSSELDHYWHLNGVPCERNKPLIHIPQYTFLSKLSGIDDKTLLIRKLAEYADRMHQTSDAHHLLEEAHQCVDSLSALDLGIFKPVVDELEGDIYFLAGKSFASDFVTSSPPGNLYAKFFIEQGNKHFLPYTPGSMKFDQHYTMSVEILSVMLESLRTTLDANKKFPRQLKMMDEINKRAQAALTKWQNSFSLVTLTQSLDEYEQYTLQLPRGKGTTELNWYSKLQKHLLGAKASYFLFSKSLSKYQQLSSIESYRLTKKTVGLHHLSIPTSPEQDKEKLYKSSLSSYEKFASAYHIDDLLLEEQLRALQQLKDISWYSENEFMKRHIEKFLSAAKNSRKRDVVMRHWLEFLLKVEDYSYLIHFANQWLSNTSSKSLYKNRDYIVCLEIVLHGYYQAKRYEDGIVFFHQHKYFDQAIKALRSLAKKDQHKTYIAFALIRTLSEAINLYKIDSLEQHQNEIRQAHEAIEEYYKRKNPQWYSIDAIRKNNFVYTRLNAYAAHVESVYFSNNRNRILSLLAPKKIRLHDWIVKANIADREPLYLRTIDLLLAYEKLFRKTETNLPKQLISEASNFIKQKQFRSWAKKSKKVRQRYFLLKKAFQKYRQ